MVPYKRSKVLSMLVNILMLLAVQACSESTKERCNTDCTGHNININVNPCQNKNTDGLINKLQADMKAMQDRLSQIEAKCSCSLLPKVHQSCNEWYLAGVNQTGYLMVDPDGDGGVSPFAAYCDMSNIIPGLGVPTEVRHDSMGKRKIHAHCEPPQCYKHEVNYMANKGQIEALLRVSKNCSQFIRYDCYLAVLFYDTKHRVAWYSRDSQEMSYWGGAQPGTRNCACGMSKSCANKGKRCNCDSNDSVWRADYGYLTDKRTIPVSMMKFGDLGDAGEEAFITLGPLTCLTDN